MASEVIKVVVLGEPKAQKRHRHFQRGKFSGTYDPSKDDKESFASILQREAPEKPLDEPLSMELRFYLGRPKSHFRSGKNSDMLKDNAPEHHIGKPDVDNMIKFCQDSLNGIYYRDDALICVLTAEKLYSDRPRTEITLTTLNR